MSKKVLIVEDDTVLRSLTRDMLKIKGYDALDAANRDEAIKLFEQNHTEIGLVIMDLNLDGVSGLDVMKELKAIDPEVKAVLASGSANDMVDAELTEAGFDEAVQKPYRMMVLHKLAEKYL